ncbi:MAG: [protein-PII] uridylyltransferase [Gammaproteobacteria bacterium]|nr:[protein-PII] uridylyltransferase [Gammaproteobacteria bacterium]NNC97827.1 [protein-PII] uridylyltransferase [Gammaproteobacteria bacterium]NNM13700.1 [protein-PII] uridylyltransferase [Gammaproteobacteria bacterium]
MSYPSTLVTACKTKIQELRSSQKASFEQTDDVSDLLKQASDTVDAVLIDLWLHYFSQHQDIQTPSLIATGGYGRAELHPGSDIDLMILLPKKHDKVIEGPIAEFLTILWDIGLEVGHSVRNLKQAVTTSKNDITIATSLQEARLIIGDKALFADMQKATGPKKLWSSKKFFQAKLEEQQARHQRYRETTYNLEPNIKGNIGGLRDLQVIAWVLKRHYDANLLEELVGLGFLTRSEFEQLDAAKKFLWKIRFALHLINGGREDRLLFDNQLKIAEQLGYRGNDSRKPVEVFMRDYYRTAQTLARLNHMLLQMFREDILEQKSRPTKRQIDKQLQSRNDYLDLSYENAFVDDPGLILRIFNVWQTQEKLRGITARTNRKLHEALDYIDDDFRNDETNKQNFMDLFKHPSRIYNTLSRMNRHKVLGLFLPVFGKIVGHMQFDLFHAYTVDAHILFVIKELEALLTGEHEDPLLIKAAAAIDKPEILLLSGLFHDIAKGRGGDHSTLGASDVVQFVKNYALDENDGELLRWLVEQHLFLSVTAQKKDIDNPAVIQEFAEVVQNQRNLDYLYLLTLADIKGTNPELWNQWKAVLFAKLYHYTAAYFAQQVPSADEHLRAKKSDALQKLKDEHSKAQVESIWQVLDDDYFLRHSPGEIRWHTRVLLTEKKFPLLSIRRQSTRHITSYNEKKALDIFVVASYDSKLFSKICVALDSLNLNITSAKLFRNSKLVNDSDSLALTFRVKETREDILIDEARKQQVFDTLQKTLHSDAQYQLVTNRITRQMRLFSRPSSIRFDSDPSTSQTILELDTLDRPGLMAMVSYCFAQLNIDVNLAKIMTIGESAEDVFYLTDKKQHALSPKLQRELADLIQATLDHKQKNKINVINI